MKRLVEMVRGVAFGVVRDRRGGVATFLAAAIIPLIAFAGLAVDTSRGYLMKARLSSALDAAALAGGRAMHDPDLRDEMVERFFNANFPANYMGATITGPTITIDTVNNTITLDAGAEMSSSLMQVLGVNTMNVAGTTEVKLSSRNVEVALVVDVTGSMAGTPISDLRTAAKDLVDIIVKDVQTPHFSKIALVPYSAAVNVGSYAAQLRGAVRPATAITGATKANPVVVTSSAHGLANGEMVRITGVNGMTQLNNIYYRVANVTVNTFELRNENNSSNINGSSYSTYSSGGTVTCYDYGCNTQRFYNVSGSWVNFATNSCVTERTGVNAYTDVAPAASAVAPVTEPVGFHYADSSNPCLAQEFVPLSSDKTLLKNRIDSLTAAGSTAGQIGLAWGWYLVSPNFGYLWPTESQPLAYGADELIKVVIFMTDGDLNTGYAKGIVAQDSGSGSGSNSDKIAQNATNPSIHTGRVSSYSQALQLCSAMKAAGILIYTVGFDIGSLVAAQEVIEQCATDPTYVYMPDSGTELSEAFQAIAINVARLHLSK
jgi:Flp pilus assembly protein TadG